MLTEALEKHRLFIMLLADNNAFKITADINCVAPATLLMHGEKRQNMLIIDLQFKKS